MAMATAKLSWWSWGCGIAKFEKGNAGSYPNPDTALDEEQIARESELKNKVETHLQLLK